MIFEQGKAKKCLDLPDCSCYSIFRPIIIHKIMNKNTNTVLPPRGLLGRFMKRVPVASFTYRKDNGDVSFRSVIVNPNESMGNHLKGFDLTRYDYRTFRRDSILSGVEVKAKYLDTVNLLVR